MKTPMQKLFERLESRPVPISTDSVLWQMLKENSLAFEQKAMEEQYWKGYKEGQYSGDKTARESYNEEYKGSPQDPAIEDIRKIEQEIREKENR